MSDIRYGDKVRMKPDAVNAMHKYAYLSDGRIGRVIRVAFWPDEPVAMVVDFATIIIPIFPAEVDLFEKVTQTDE